MKSEVRFGSSVLTALETCLGSSTFGSAASIGCSGVVFEIADSGNFLAGCDEGSTALDTELAPHPIVCIINLK